MKRLIDRYLLLFCIVFMQGTLYAETRGPDEMQELYQRIKPILDEPTPENPFYLQAENKEGNESGEAALYIPLSLEELSSAIGSVENWCNILPVHINVKACTYNNAGNGMTLYMGRKFYQEPDDAFELTYRFSIVKSDDYFSATAVAPEGPLQTTDYRIVLEFIDIGEKTFGRIYVSNQQSWMSKKAMQVYLSTLGKDKKGIKVIDHDKQGDPIYSSDGDGVAERNLVRYYFAFLSYFENSDEPDPAKRYSDQLVNWFDKTEKFPQLHEVEKPEYIESKHKERENQLALQQAIINKG